MSQFVEYAMKIKDMATGPLGSIANSFDNVTNHANKAGKASSLFSKMVAGAFNLNNIIGAAQGVMNVAKSVGSAIGSTMQASLDRQQLQVSFDVLTGSKEAGGKLTQQLVNLQKDTVLGAEVFKNAQTMLGFGFKDTEILENMRMLGDVSMGDAEKLNSLTLAFSQVRSAGKLQGQDLLQLINAGFNPLEQMSKRTGKSIATLKDEMSKGNISFEMVQQAFKDATSEGGRYNNMLATIAQTDAGMKAQLAGAWDEVKIKIGNAFQPLTRMGLELGTKLLPLIEKLTEPLGAGVQKTVGLFNALIVKAQNLKPIIMQFVSPLQDMTSRLRESLDGLSDFLEPIRIVIAEHIYPYAIKIWNVATGIIGDFVSFVSQSELLKDVFSSIGFWVGKIYDCVGYLVDGLKWVWDNVVMPLLNGIEKAYRWIKGSPMPGGTHKKSANAPVVPTAANPIATTKTTDKLAEIAKNTKANAQSGKATSAAVASAGPKQITINVQKFFDNIQFSTTNLSESTAQIQEAVLECLSRVLVQGATTA